MDAVSCRALDNIERLIPFPRQQSNRASHRCAVTTSRSAPLLQSSGGRPQAHQRQARDGGDYEGSVAPAQLQTARCTPQGNVELMPKKEVLDFEPSPDS